MAPGHGSRHSAKAGVIEYDSRSKSEAAKKRKQRGVTVAIVDDDDNNNNNAANGESRVKWRKRVQEKEM